MTKGLQEKLRIAESFMETAKFLDKTLRKFVIGGSSETVEARRDTQLIRGKAVCHFLYAVVFEIAIKIIWEIDKGEECRKTHDILCLYNELSREKQLRIKNLYDNQVSLLKVEGRKGDGRSIRVDSLVNLQSLEDALESNSDTMTDFKYDGKFRGKSSAIGGIIWTSETVWVLPERFVIFPIQLLDYAKENLESYTV